MYSLNNILSNTCDLFELLIFIKYEYCRLRKYTNHDRISIFRISLAPSIFAGTLNEFPNSFSYSVNKSNLINDYEWIWASACTHGSLWYM